MRAPTIFLPIAALVAGCSTSDCPSGTTMLDGRCLEVDASTPSIDAIVRPDSNVDAPGLDAFEPDAFEPPDAWIPGDGGPCSRCEPETPACDDDGVTCVECTSDTHCADTSATPACLVAMQDCVECTNDTHCAGNPSGPACDTATNTCVPCNTATAAMDCPAPLAACLDHTCVRCDDRADCTTATDMPYCTSANTCVQCEDRGDCTDNPGFPACTGNACVQCQFNSDCPSASASRCTGTTCGACMADADCSHLGGTPRCVSGTCRACTVATEIADCGANSCNPATNTCTMTPRNMTNVCEPCVADSECRLGFTCGAVNPARGVTGNYCLPIRATTCGALRPYFEAVNGDITDLGTMVNYCRPRTTTCEATLDHGDAVSEMGLRCGNTPDGTDDDACGVFGMTDGLCRTTGGGDNRCTYSCIGNDDCPCPLGLPTCGSSCTGGYCSI